MTYNMMDLREELPEVAQSKALQVGLLPSCLERLADKDMQENSALLRANTIKLTSIEPDRLTLRALESGKTEIVDRKNAVVLGTVSQPAADDGSLVEIYLGKGGLTAVLTSPGGLRYFALPGARVSVGQTELCLFGDPITTNPDKTRKAISRDRVQRHSSQAMILGAGLATRFEPISGERTGYAKPSVFLADGKSVICCIADALARDGFQRIVVNTFFMPDSLKFGLKDCKGVQVSYIDEEAPSGTAGALRKILRDPQYSHLLDLTQPLMLILGDAVTDVNFSELMESHIRNQALITIGCQMVADKDLDKFGIIVTDQGDADGVSGGITCFQEKPGLANAKSRLGNTGFYIFSPQAYPVIAEIYEELLAEKREAARKAGQPEPAEVLIDFANDVFPRVLARVESGKARGKFWAQLVEGYWTDIGTPAQYVETVHDLYAGKVDIALGENPQTFYDQGVIYWPGTQEAARREQACLEGNVVVTKPYQGTTRV